MMISFSIGERQYAANTDSAIDISIPLDFQREQPGAFHLPRAAARPIDTPSFVADVSRGSGFNCMTLTMTPHGNGTHTECIGHISAESYSVATLVRPALVPALLLSVTPTPARMAGEEEHFPSAQDLVIGAPLLTAALKALGGIPDEFYRALIIRTLPNSAAKLSMNYSGTNPPYFSRAAMRLIRQLGTEHLLCDLPSVDRESDGGALAAHRIFWGTALDRCAKVTPSHHTITELIYVDAAVRDGLYLLDLQLPQFLLEAVPSRPVLFPVSPLRGADV